MDTVLELLKVLNTISPLAVIALLALVLFYMAKAKGQAQESFTTLTENHLHELPAILEALQRMEMAFQRIETTHAAAFATIIAKLNGGHK